MTMRLTVKNEDSARVAYVVEETYNINQPGSRPHQTPWSIPAGEERVFHIHAAKRLLITEDGEASVPKVRA